ncbi:MAG: GNAT family N-acetyltransferase [Clostridia bacterium]|nr:GNAT family N-acetyltransferase [Clostridia bacterium]
MELRRLTVQDRAILTELFKDVFTNEPWNDDWSNAEQLDAYIADLTGQSNSLPLGYFDGDRLVGLSLGYVKHWYTGTEYCIDEFCVGRGLQGKGIGTAFLQDIEAFLAERQITQIFLQTDRSVPAYAFYRSRGFLELESHVSFAKKVKRISCISPDAAAVPR